MRRYRSERRQGLNYIEYTAQKIRSHFFKLPNESLFHQTVEGYKLFGANWDQHTHIQSHMHLDGILDGHGIIN